VPAVLVLEVLRLLLRARERRALAAGNSAGVLHGGGEKDRDAVLEPAGDLGVHVGEDDDVDAAVLVVEHELRHQLAFVRPLLDLVLLQLADDPAEVDRLVDLLPEVLRRRVRKELELLGELVERMPADVEAERLLLVAELLVVGPVGPRLDRRLVRLRLLQRDRRDRTAAEERALPALLLLARLERLVGRALDLVEEHPARRAERIHRTRLHERLEHFLVAGAQVDLLAEIEERLEASRLAPRGEDRLDGPLAHSLHRA